MHQSWLWNFNWVSRQPTYWLTPLISMTLRSLDHPNISLSSNNHCTSSNRIRGNKPVCHNYLLFQNFCIHFFWKSSQSFCEIDATMMLALLLLTCLPIFHFCFWCGPIFKSHTRIYLAAHASTFHILFFTQSYLGPQHPTRYRATTAPALEEVFPLDLWSPSLVFSQVK